MYISKRLLKRLLIKFVISEFVFVYPRLQLLIKALKYKKRLKVLMFHMHRTRLKVKRIA